MSLYNRKHFSFNLFYVLIIGYFIFYEFFWSTSRLFLFCRFKRKGFFISFILDFCFVYSTAQQNGCFLEFIFFIQINFVPSIIVILQCAVNLM